MPERFTQSGNRPGGTVSVPQPSYPFQSHWSLFGGISPKARFAGISIAIVVLFIVFDLLALPSSNVRLTSDDLLDLLKVELVLAACAGAGHAVRRRLASDASGIAVYIRGLGEMLAAGSLAMLVFLPLIYFGVVFSYVSSATTKALVDADLSAIDMAFGFDWLWFLEATNDVPLISRTLRFAYHSLTYQVPLIAVVLCMTRRFEGLFEYVALFALTLLMSCIGMALFPAAGAYAFYDPPADMYSSYSSMAGMWHFDQLQALRSGEPFIFVSNETQGIVTFPSFHTALGIIITYALRDISPLAWPVGVLNALMIIGTMPEGGHHMIDVLAGAAIAIVSILIVRFFHSQGADRESLHMGLI